MAKTKISQLIEAGNNIEKTKTGFTVSELMSALRWIEDNEIQYARNAMVTLTKKGQARKLINSRPVVYSFKKNHIAKATQSIPLHSSLKTPEFHPDGCARKIIPLKEDGESRRGKTLEHRIKELETQLAETKQKLAEAQANISKHTRTIEMQDRIIKGQKRERNAAPVMIFKRRGKKG
ncbi:MAG: hypothetical protein VR64_14435 [Desulfatitalea sp. BRH_c12]|nr:MAG: hypothetical protein VR64_14435 [Desulfatitalea sp. BRH_c12]